MQSPLPAELHPALGHDHPMHVHCISHYCLRWLSEPMDAQVVCRGCCKRRYRPPQAQQSMLLPLQATIALPGQWATWLLIHPALPVTDCHHQARTNPGVFNFHLAVASPAAAPPPVKRWQPRRMRRPFQRGCAASSSGKWGKGTARNQ